MDKKKNKVVEPLINVARSEFQVTKEFPLIVTLDTPTGKATVIAHYNANEVITSDADTKKLLQSDIQTKLKGDKRYVTIPWVEDVSKGYYADEKGGIIPVRNRIDENILIYGASVSDHATEINHIPVTAWENSNYIVIGSHFGLEKTDWSKYIFIPVMTNTGSVVFIINPDSGEYLPFLKYSRKIVQPFRGYELKDTVKTSEPPLVKHITGVTKAMKQAKSLVRMRGWFEKDMAREAFLYQTPNHIFINIDDVEYKAERVPADISDMPEGLELYNIHTHKLTACIGVYKGNRKARAILSVKVRYVSTPLTRCEKYRIKINKWTMRNLPVIKGSFMGIDFKLVDSPVALSTLNYDTKAELVKRYDSFQVDIISTIIS